MSFLFQPYVLILYFNLFPLSFFDRLTVPPSTLLVPWACRPPFGVYGCSQKGLFLQLYCICAKFPRSACVLMRKIRVFVTFSLSSNCLVHIHTLTLSYSFILIRKMFIVEFLQTCQSRFCWFLLLHIVWKDGTTHCKLTLNSTLQKPLPAIMLPHKATLAICSHYSHLCAWFVWCTHHTRSPATRLLPVPVDHTKRPCPET